MSRFTRKIKATVAVTFALALASVGAVAIPAGAATTPFWGAGGPGISARALDNNSTVNIAGTSKAGVWSGALATTANQMPAKGTLNLIVRGNSGKNCEGGTCPYGKGTGYRALAQFRFDAQNYYQIGILDEGYVTWGPMIIVEGTQQGKHFRILEPLITDAQKLNNASIIRKMQSGQSVDLDQQHYVQDYRHLIKAQWNQRYIMFTLDNTRMFGGYLFTPGNKNGPAVTFSGAAKNPGDLINVTFDYLNFSGKVPGSSVFIPKGKPYAIISANVKNTGYGIGHSAYIRFHDAYGTAISAGIQTAATAPETGGAPWVISGRMQDGIFDYDYVQPSSHDWHNLRIEWWKDSGWAVIWYDGQPIANMKSNLKGRLFFAVEGNAANNNDSVHSYFSNVEVQVGHTGGDCGTHGTWSSGGTYGIGARQTGDGKFEVAGTARGIPAGKDWDTTLVGGTMMTFQYLPENGQSGRCVTTSWAEDPAHNKVKK